MGENGILRVGIIGAGWIAEKAAITLNGLKECKAYAVGSRSLEKAEAFAKQWSISKAYGSYSELIADALGVAFTPYYVASDYLADIAPKAYDLRGNLLGDKACSVVFDCSKLKRAVPGFCATTPFHEGVRRSIAYLKEHPESQIEDPEFDTWCDKVIATMERAKTFSVDR